MMQRCMGCMSEYDSGLNVCPHCNYQKNSKPKQPYALMPESVLDRKYIVGRVVSEDNFAIRYLAWDFENCYSVIIKEYYPKELCVRMPGCTDVSFYDGEKAKQFESGLVAFVEEANELIRISQNLDGIVKVKGLFVENSTAYTVSENPEAVSFKDMIESEGKIPWQDAVGLMLPLINSLNSIHKNGLINYGVCPEKIILTRDGQMKLLEFGASRFATVGNSKNYSLIANDGFSALELYRDENVITASSDVYSVAATLYYAITGIVPDSAIERSRQDNLLPPSELGVDIDPHAETAILNALNVSAAYRTRSCSEFLEQLSGMTDIERVVEKNDAAEAHGWSGKVKISVIISAVIVIGAIIAIFLSGRAPKNREQASFAIVPDFTGQTIEQAADYLESELGLREDQIVNVGYYESENEENDGKIVWQSVTPDYGISESEKSDFMLEVRTARYNPDAANKANQKVTMINIVGMDVNTAISEMEKAGFLRPPVKLGSEYNNSVKAGLICRQSALEGKEMTAGDEVGYYISNGPEPKTDDTETKKTAQATTVRSSANNQTTNAVTEQTTRAPIADKSNNSQNKNSNSKDNNQKSNNKNKGEDTNKKITGNSNTKKDDKFSNNETPGAISETNVSVNDEGGIVLN